MNVYSRFRRFLYQGFIPVTKSLIVLGALIFILYYVLQLFHFRSLYNLLGLFTGGVFHYPWTLLTYPLVNPDPFSLIFGLLWLWFVGGSLERSWGSWTFGIYLFWVTLFTGIMITLVGFIVGKMIFISGFWIPLVALTWAWASIFPDREILFWGIIPLRAKWLAWINAVIVFFNYALQSHWLMGFASISGILILYLFGGKGGFFFKDIKSWLEERRRKARRNKFKVYKH